jgi:D-tagatose-1,6-bisphosphate aldolase subunit GatZ/KbaZ
LFAPVERSNIIAVLDDVMREHPEYWVKYYLGSEGEQAFKRKYSLSDRIRYYWSFPTVRQAFEIMMKNLDQNPLPVTLLKRYAPEIYSMTGRSCTITPQKLLLAKIQNVLKDYVQACNLQ